MPGYSAKTRIIRKRPQSTPQHGFSRISSNNHVVTMQAQGLKHVMITVHPEEAKDPDVMFKSLAETVDEEGVMILTQFVFGGTELRNSGVAGIEKEMGPLSWPVTWIEGEGASEPFLTGTQVHAVSGSKVRAIRLAKHVIGNLIEDDDAEYCILGDLRPDPSLPREEQVENTFRIIEEALEVCDMDFSNVARTWFYLEDINSWYDGFNRVRTDFFNKRGVFDRMVPASTGIGVANHAGAAVVADVYAIKPKKDSVAVFAVPSPLQCPAIDYKSSFSRGVEIATTDQRLLMISGTASIAPGGETVFLDDTAKQIQKTMEVVDAILKSRQMDWSDTTRAIAYFTKVEDAYLLDEYCEANGLPDMPIAVAHGEICRPDLLFELELDACVAK